MRLVPRCACSTTLPSPSLRRVRCSMSQTQQFSDIETRSSGHCLMASGYPLNSKRSYEVSSHIFRVSRGTLYLTMQWSASKPRTSYSAHRSGASRSANSVCFSDAGIVSLLPVSTITRIVLKSIFNLKFRS